MRSVQAEEYALSLEQMAELSLEVLDEATRAETEVLRLAAEGLADPEHACVRSMGPDPLSFVLWTLTDLLWEVIRPNKGTTHE